MQTGTNRIQVENCGLKYRLKRGGICLKTIKETELTASFKIRAAFSRNPVLACAAVKSYFRGPKVRASTFYAGP